MRKHSRQNDKTNGSDKIAKEDRVIECLSLLQGMVQQAIPKTLIGILQRDLTDDGSARAAWHLYRITSILVSALEQLGRRKPNLLRPIAEETEAWPGIISSHPDYDKSNRELVKRIGLG